MKAFMPVWVRCNGDAHSNPNIDHCGGCMPFWGEYPTCVQCGGKLTFSKSSAAAVKYYCRVCKKHYFEGDRNGAR